MERTDFGEFSASTMPRHVYWRPSTRWARHRVVPTRPHEYGERYTRRRVATRGVCRHHGRHSFAMLLGGGGGGGVTAHISALC